MKEYDVNKVKNIAFAGHNGSGKTSLAEAILYKAGASDRLGKTADGTTVCDYDPEEIKRQISIGTSLASFEYNGFKVNLLDTPGLFDFAAEMIEGIRASDTVMITVSAKSGVKVGARKAYDEAVKQGKSKMFVVTKIDDKDANFFNVLTELKTVFGPTVCPVVVPVVSNGQIVEYVNLIEMKCYKYDSKGNAIETEMPTAEISEKFEYRVDGLVAAVSEAVAETSEELMEKFFEGEAFTQKELIDGIHDGMNRGIITPVVCTSASDLAGIDMLLKEIELLLPSPNEVYAAEAYTPTKDIVEVDCDAEAPLSAFVFKTIADPFVGKMSFIRVMSGKLTSNCDVVNSTTGAAEKIGKLYNLCGKKQSEVSAAYAGDIVVASKISANTGDTLSDSSRVVEFAGMEFPRPCYSMAVKAKAQGDEAKISASIQRLIEEDPTLTYIQDETTKEQILSGLGEQHIEVAAAKLKTKFGVEVNLTVPKIAYKETIRKKVKVQGRHKKQSGGHGQFGDVWIEFEPCVSDTLVFEEKIFGGAVPKNFFPAVQKGLEESVKKGVLAGCPVVGLKAILVDGSYHPVDSSEMAFKTAASIAYKEGLRQADPVMLEPIGELKVTAPDDNTGDIMGELNKRRGRVLGMEPVGGGNTLIQAEVPMREMHDFAMYLRQTTRGMGSFTFEFVRYEQLPSNLVTEVISAVGNVD
ncbi:elongation factor G [uncultured Ruminococcus sp.]|uniref:elongation factor G n=1 Tax=uncultured Ruminococcus sp. TaxID=165186 RepID=UPI0026222278|nr:elongation factor G [uncultured Ruminococcus sp.]